MEYFRTFLKCSTIRNHLFHIFCHNKEENGIKSGLGCILKELNIPGYNDSKTIANSEIYSDVNVIRDVFDSSDDKVAFRNQLYFAFLPIIRKKYEGEIDDPITPDAIVKEFGIIHPEDYGAEVEKLGNREDVLFYIEYSALFSAKIDFLIFIGDHLLWIMVNPCGFYWKDQIRRIVNIATLCSSNFFPAFFHNRKPMIVLLGPLKNEDAAREAGVTHFLSLYHCRDIARKLFPEGELNYTYKVLDKFLEQQPHRLSDQNC